MNPIPVDEYPNHKFVGYCLRCRATLVDANDGTAHNWVDFCADCKEELWAKARSTGSTDDEVESIVSHLMADWRAKAQAVLGMPLGLLDNAAG